MIKTFEQFVSAKYGKPVNEGFQSSKLREVIKQHGLPKNDWDKKMLYDLKDEEIVDVVDNRDEYYEKYEDYGKDEAAFMIELEDGFCVVISNLGILKDYLKHKEKNKIFKKRYEKRHKGNLGKLGGDDIRIKHLTKVDELVQKRFAAKLQPILPEIAKAIKTEMERIDSSDLDEAGNFSKEFEITLGKEKYVITADYEVEFSGEHKSYGAYYYDIIYTLTSFNIWNENSDEYTTNDMLGITSDTYGDLFEPITIDDVEGEIYDHYEYYGVSRSDFY